MFSPFVKVIIPQIKTPIPAAKYIKDTNILLPPINVFYISILCFVYFKMNNFAGIKDNNN